MVAGSWVEGQVGESLFNGTVLFYKMKRVTEMDGGNGFRAS